jgi:demethylmenaquinone methyltransferase/2-methoxy-6-polyprenyl-1,4-benzoquinol methylase
MRFFDHFDLLAPIYDRLIAEPDHDVLAAAAQLPVEGRLLDVGGGTGRTTQKLTGRARHVVLADSSLRMLRQTKDKDGLMPVGSLAEQLPFPQGCFERVVMVDAYHHLHDQGASLQEFWRVLAPGGLAVIEEPDIDQWAVKLVALAEKLALFRSHFVRAEDLALQLERLGAQTTIQRQPPNVWVIAEKPR